MALIATISLVVPDLPDNETAFANNSAWKNYWKNIDVSATFTAAVNDQYVESAYDATIAQFDLAWEGINYSLPTIAQFNSLLLAYQVLNTNYKNMRQAMKDAGFISQAQ